MTAGCPSGKKPYDTGQAARRALQGVQRRRRGHAEQSAYKCPHCHAWHLTSLTSPRKGTRT